MSKRDVAETILEAVDIVVNKRLEGVKFDATDVATIIDDKSAKIGRYIVSTGSVSYVAYSNDTTYRNGDCVYVTIPNGDYDNQKIISGKKVSGSEEPYIYVSPFDSIIDVTGNICDIDTSEHKNGWGLVANLPSKQPEDWTGPEDIEWKTAINIWDRTFTTENLVGFTRLGIQAQFQSWLSTWKTIFGSYGLLLVVDYQMSDSDSFIKNCDRILNRLSNFLSPTTSTQEKVNRWNWITQTCSLANELTTLIDPQTNVFYEIDTITDDIIAAIQNEVNQLKDNAKGQLYLVFDCNRFQGDPYNFSTFYQQETVFDLSQSLGDTTRITRLSLYFYEKPSDSSIPEDGYPKQGFKGLNVSAKDKNDNNEDLPYGDIPYTTGDDIFSNIASPNLWVKDVYICLGYDLGSFNQDSVQLYSISSPTYKYEIPGEYAENDSLRKDLEVRWIHEFEDGVFNEVYQSRIKNLNYEIRWYRYKQGAKAPDNYAGAFWERINTPNNSFNQIVELDPKLSTEKFKVIILLFDEVIRPDQNNGYEQLVINKYESNILEFTNEENVVNDEILQAIDGYSLFCVDRSDGNYFIYGQNQTIKDQVEAYEIRQLQCYYKEDKYSTPSAVTQAQYIVWRIPASDSMITLADSFSFDYTKQPTIVQQMTEANTPPAPGAINHFYVNEWPGVDNIPADGWFPCLPFSIRRPGEEVVVNLESDSNTYLCKNHQGNWFNDSHDVSNDGGSTLYHILYSRVYYDKSTNEYVIAYKGDPNHGYFINPVLEYRVLSHYYEDRFSNTITCEIKTIDNNIYTITKQFQFGPAGTNGSQYTVVVNFDDNNDDNDNKYVISADAQEDIKVSATILGPGGHAADLQTNPIYTWEWAEGTYISDVSNVNLNSIAWLQNNGCIIGIGYYDSTEDRYQYINGQAHGPTMTLFHGKRADDQDNKLLNSLLYLKCTVSGLESYDLVTIVPIAVRKLSTYEKVKGPSIVAYHSDGYVDYTREPFQIQDKRDAEGRHIFTSSDSAWKIYTPSLRANRVIDGFLGEISLDGHFTPLGNYVEGAGQYGVQCYAVADGNINENNILYTQPIYFCENRYSSGALNNWNGKELVIDYDNGLVMTNAISAGKKNSDNTFSGVMMGDWSGEALDTHSVVSGQTGIYGFNHGAMSYAFTEDGTGFIGKDGMGRILFDGNKSTIKSQAYQQNRGGMKIDLDDGVINIKGSFKENNPQYNGYFEAAVDVDSNNYQAKINDLYVRQKTNDINSDNEPYSFFEYKKVDTNSTFSPSIQYYYFINSNNSVKRGTGGRVVQNIYSPSGSSVYISANGPDYLTIKTENPAYSTNEHPITTRGNEILHIGSEQYFLQSDDWTGDEQSEYYSLVEPQSEVNSSNYTNYFVIDENNYDYILDYNDYNENLMSSRHYYIKDEYNQYGDEIKIRQYESGKYYTDFRLDTSESCTNDRQYYTLNKMTGEFSTYQMVQNFYQQNYYYYRVNTGKMLDPYGEYKSDLVYYHQNEDKTFTEENLVSYGDYQKDTYYISIGQNEYELSSAEAPQEGVVYYSRELIYEGYSLPQNTPLPDGTGYYGEIGQPTYNIVGKYTLQGGTFELATGNFDSNTIYYDSNQNIVILTEPVEYSPSSDIQYCTYNPISGLYSGPVAYEDLQGGVTYYLREYQGLEQDGETVIYNYTEVGMLYVENYYYILTDATYVLVQSNNEYDSTKRYYDKINDNYVLASPSDYIVPPNNFTTWQGLGLLYIQYFQETNLGWEWHSSIDFYDGNYQKFNNQTDFNNAQVHYILSYTRNTLSWDANTDYYMKNIEENIYDYKAEGVFYSINYEPNKHYVDYVHIEDENLSQPEETYRDYVINFDGVPSQGQANYLYLIAQTIFRNEAMAIMNGTKKTYVDYIEEIHDDPDSNVVLSKIYRADIDTEHNIFTFYVLNSSGNEVAIYYNTNYEKDKFYYLDDINNINLNNKNEFLYNSNTFRDNYSYYEYYDIFTQVYFYRPGIYYYRNHKYRKVNSDQDQYSSSIQYYQLNEKSGTKIDIAKGRITSYNLMLTGYNIDNQQRKRINITSVTDDANYPYPLTIGVENNETFKVSWDGTLWSASAHIGGWIIDGTKIYSADVYEQDGTININKNHITLDSAGNIEANFKMIDGIPSGWQITQNGQAYFSEGTIGGWSMRRTFLAGNFNESNWTADTWLFSKDQETSRTIPFIRKTDGTYTYSFTDAYEKQWRILIGHSDNNHYNFGINKNGEVIARKIWLMDNSLVINGETVTIKDVTIPVAFKAVAVEGWTTKNGSVYWETDVLAYLRNLTGAQSLSYIIGCTGEETTGTVVDSMYWSPSDLYGRCTGYYGMNIWAQVPGTNYVYQWTSGPTFSLYEFIGDYTTQNKLKISGYAPAVLPDTKITGYKAYITKVAKAKLLFQGTNGIVTESLITLNAPNGYLLTSGNNAYGLVQNGELWEPNFETNTFKLLTTGDVKDKTVFIGGEINIGDYDY